VKGRKQRGRRRESEGRDKIYDTKQGLDKDGLEAIGKKNIDLIKNGGGASIAYIDGFPS
jgi:hypothetical protein